MIEQPLKEPGRQPTPVRTSVLGRLDRMALTRSARTADVVARLGGDEFAVFLPETSLEGAESFFSRARSELLSDASRFGWPIGFSIGVAVFDNPPADIDPIVRAADRLMYGVKRAGKDSVSIALANAPNG